MKKGCYIKKLRGSRIVYQKKQIYLKDRCEWLRLISTTFYEYFFSFSNTVSYSYKYSEIIEGSRVHICYNSSGDTGCLVSRGGTMTLDLYAVGVVRSTICAPWEKSETSILCPDMENGAGLCESQDKTPSTFTNICWQTQTEKAEAWPRFHVLDRAAFSQCQTLS